MDERELIRAKWHGVGARQEESDVELFATYSAQQAAIAAETGATSEQFDAHRLAYWREKWAAKSVTNLLETRP